MTDAGPASNAGPERMRLDVFLWRARFFKVRSTAAEAVETVGVRIERAGHVRRVDKAATPVEPGDILSFACPAGVRLVRILALPVRRGPPSEAALCYEPVVADAMRPSA